VVADYVISAYFQSSDGIYVNLFVPSEMKWRIDERPVRMIQTTNYPESEGAELRLDLPAPTEFTLYVRIPGWLESRAELRVNQRAISSITPTITLPRGRSTFPIGGRVAPEPCRKW